MSILERCSWKMVSPDKFVMGQIAARCGDIADVVVLRPNRKTDLFLCEKHINEFIKQWGLHNEVKILCQELEEICPYDCEPCHDPDYCPCTNCKRWSE